MDYLLLNEDNLMDNRFDYAFPEGVRDPGMQTFSAQAQREKFLGGSSVQKPSEPSSRTTASKQPVDSASRGEDRISLLQDKVSLGEDYIIGNHNGNQFILDKDGEIVVQVAKSDIARIDDKSILVARVRDRADFSGASLQDTNVLLVGDKVFSTLLNPQEEMKKGYKMRESITIVLGHELTHVKMHTMPDEQKRQISEYYAANWGSVHEFATALLTREDYQKAVLSQTVKALAKDPNTKTRPVSINGRTFEVAVEAIADELLAYNSSNELLGNQRMRELAAINPTGDQISREFLSVKAGEVFKKLHGGQTIPGYSLYENLPQHVDQVSASVTKLARSS
ncbi:MAG: hypothetical protein Q7K55_06640 [Candidatus Levybacteria bacterium]|nr:hypothetical protein [Candidatus Levybacteria bacterium]